MIEEQIDPQPATQAPDAAEAPKADAAPAPDQGKGERPKWMKQLDGDLQENDFLAQFKSFSDPARKLLELEGKRDRLVEIPGEDASDDVKTQFGAKLRKITGVPEKPEDYKLTVPTLPKELNLTWKPETEAAFRKKAHELGLNQAQFTELVQADTARVVAGAQARLAAAQKAKADADNQAQAFLSKLKTDWGQNFEANTAKSTAAMAKTATEDFQKLLASATLPGGGSLKDHPLTAQFFFDIGNVVGEGTFIRGGVGSVETKPTGPLKISPKLRETLNRGKT